MRDEKHLTPLQSERKYCLWCCAGQATEVRLCPKTDCPLYNFRFGKRRVKESTIKAARKRCLDCKNGAVNVENCDDTDCPLFIYRMGKNPSRKGKGGMSTPKNRLYQKNVDSI